MDPITTAIIGAVSNLSVTAIKDAYNGIKALIKKKFGDDSDVADAVEKLEKKPDSDARRGMLQEEVAATGADQDNDLLQIAEALIVAIKEQPGGEQVIYNIKQKVKGDHNIFSGSGDVSVSGKTGQ